MIEGNSMAKNYIAYETIQDGMKVILEVPEQSKEDETAKQEVRKILAAFLTEYLHNFLRTGRGFSPAVCREKGGTT